MGAASGPVWSETTRVRGFAVTLAALVVVLAAFAYQVIGASRRAGDAAEGLAVATATIAFAAFVMLLFLSVDVTLDRERLTVRSSILRIPLRRLPLGDIAGARVETIRPMAYGGWGYRMKRGLSAVVIRKGEALFVETRVGRNFAVTVDRAGEAAALINGLVAGAVLSPIA